MWKVAFDSDGHKPITMERAFGPPVMIEQVFGDRDDSAPRGPPRFTQKEKKQYASFDPFQTPAAEWTEPAMYTFLSGNPRRLPKLQDIEEMLLRKVGNPKFKCVFQNDEHEDCVVWVSATLMHIHYPGPAAHATRTFGVA